jgi:tRNA (adenine22-N1)-methyltransferase
LIRIRPLQLSPRLLTVASFIRPGDRVLDIGCDHARLPVYLTERGLCAAVTAADISEGPLARASKTIRKHRLEGKIALVLCSGAEGLDSEDYDTVVISGMGGDTIIDILQNSRWLMTKRLILQPQTRVDRFAEMAGLPYAHKAEAIEGRRRYFIFVWDGEV